MSISINHKILIVMQVAKISIPKPYPSICALTFGTDSVETTNKINWWQIGDNYKWHIEEKIDGSQLSFFVDTENNIHFYNKASYIKHDTNNAVFEKAITMLCQSKIINLINKNYVYAGESVCKLKHNVIVYERTPKYYFIVYDIYDFVENKWLSLQEKLNECSRIGLEHVVKKYAHTFSGMLEKVNYVNFFSTC